MALNKAADAEHRLLVPGRVHRPGISGGLWLGGASREPLQGG